jgi:hypothetical protein
MNNVIFNKTLEIIDKHINIKLYKNLDKISSNPFFMNLYNELKNIIISNKKKFNKNKIVIKKIDDKATNYLIDNNFTSINIRNYIINNLKYSYNITYNNNTIIYFTKKNIDLINIPKIIIEILFIVVIIKKLFKRDYSQKIIFFETNKKKLFPKKIKILDSDNINTALTFLEFEIKNGDIILYRKEEFIKVLIHELIHSNLIDEVVIYSQKSKIFSNLFCSNYKVLLNESITETLACIINIFYKNIINILKNKNNVELNNVELNNLDIMFMNEYKYSIYICSKIKTYYNIDNISNILKIKNNKIECLSNFPQKTNVLSYYFLKNILLKNHLEFGKLLTKYTINYKINNDNFNNKILKLIINNFKNLDKDLINIKDNNNSLKMSLY